MLQHLSVSAQVHTNMAYMQKHKVLRIWVWNCLEAILGNFDVAWQPLWHTNGVFDDIFCIYGTLILAATTSAPPWCRGRPRTSLALGSIAFYSKCLNPGQCKYSTYNQELLACVLGIKKFQYFLEGQHLIFTLDFSSQTHVWENSQHDNFLAWLSSPKTPDTSRAHSCSTLWWTQCLAPLAEEEARKVCALNSASSPRQWNEKK